MFIYFVFGFVVVAAHKFIHKIHNNAADYTGDADVDRDSSGSDAHPSLNRKISIDFGI